MRCGVGFWRGLMCALVVCWLNTPTCSPVSEASEAKTRDVRLADSFSPIISKPVWTSSGHILLLHPCCPANDPEGWVKIYRPDGTEVTQLSPAKVLPKAVQASIWDANTDPSGRLVAIAVTAVEDEAKGYNAIAEYTTSGTFVRAFETGLRSHWEVAIDSDGNIWSFGTDGEKERQGDDYPVVICYGADGSTLKELIPRSYLPPQIRLGEDGPQIGGRLFFEVTKQGFYFFIPQTQQFVEADFAGHILSNFSLLKPDLAEGSDPARKVKLKFVDGFAVSRAGQVFAQFQEEYEKGAEKKQAFALFRLNRETSRWVLHGEVHDLPWPGRLLGWREGGMLFLVGEENHFKLLTMPVQ